MLNIQLNKCYSMTIRSNCVNTNILAPRKKKQFKELNEKKVTLKLKGMGVEINKRRERTSCVFQSRFVLF